VRLEVAFLSAVPIIVVAVIIIAVVVTISIWTFYYFYFPERTMQRIVKKRMRGEEGDE
jgi:hypothetical protein